MKPYYEHAGITIYHGDCREIIPALPLVDLIFTSPPYNLGVTTGGGFPTGHYDPSAPLGQKRGGMGKWSKAATAGGLAHGYGSHDDAMPWPEYEARQRSILDLCWSVLSEEGAIYYNHKPRAQSCIVWLPTALNPGLPLRQIITWARAGGINFAPTHYVPTYEWILLFAKSAFRLRDKAASGAGDVWYVPQESNTEHPAPFPIGLPLRALETTKPGLVLDPFAGSGTTLMAAKEVGRRAIGIEIEERYCEISAKRLAQEVMDFG